MTVSKALSQTEFPTMERLCEITYAYVGKDYLLSGNTWLIIQCLKFKLGDLHWSPDILLLHTPPRQHIYCLSSLFRYMCAICFCQIWKESCRPKMTSAWKSCTKTTMLRARTKSTLPWNNWWWVWVSLHSSFHLCSCSRSFFWLILTLNTLSFNLQHYACNGGTEGRAVLKAQKLFLPACRHCPNERNRSQYAVTMEMLMHTE